MSLPDHYRRFLDAYPDVARAYAALGEAAHQAGPLNDRERRLVKLALAVGAQTEGGVHSQVRKAQAAGLTPDELRQVALLAITTLGFPAAMAALSWVEDQLSPEGGPQP